MIVITLSKTPASLRGDLTKWCQEIQTGIYVGNVNAKVRDLLWERVQKNIGQGEATLVYNTNNELGYTFRTTRADRKVVDLDGIPFLKHINSSPIMKTGFSNAAKYHKASKNNRSLRKGESNEALLKFVALDIETTGLDPTKSEIISIGAVKYTMTRRVELFYELNKDATCIPEKVSKLTGIDLPTLNSSGNSLETILPLLKDFLEDRIILGYNLTFDLGFLNKAFEINHLSGLLNTSKDLLAIIKKRNKFLDNYQLNTVLSEYDIENENPHHADSDARCTWQLAAKLIEKGQLKL